MNDQYPYCFQPEAETALKTWLFNRKTPAFLLVGPPGIGKTTIAESIAADRKAYSLDQPLSEHSESESTLLDVYDGTVGSEQHVYDEENYRHILKLLTEDLVPREKEVVERIHALNGRMMPQTFTDIAEEWGCQAETVRVVYRKTIRKMQKKARHLRINISSIF